MGSRRGNSNGQHCHHRLYRRLLSTSVNERHHILRRIPQLERLHKSCEFSPISSCTRTNRSQFFIAPWQAKSGWTITFAAQGIITFFATVPVIAALHILGPRIRGKSGQPSWVNPEFDSAL